MVPRMATDAWASADPASWWRWPGGGLPLLVGAHRHRRAFLEKLRGRLVFVFFKLVFCTTR